MSDSSDSSDAPELETAVDSFLAGLSDDARAAIGTILPPAPGPEPRDGPRLIGGDFELGRELGAGSMGIVYEARQRSVADRRVAVKVLDGRRAGRIPQERFRREIAAISRLDHPHIVTVYASGVDRLTPFYAMKLVEGTSASRLIAALRGREARPDRASEVSSVLCPEANGSSPAKNLEGSYVDWVASVGFHLADALEHAHELGIVHRDVKPSNVMITAEGSPVLTDFGLARDEQEETLTEEGLFLGTLAYASPEQATGGRVDSRSDVYSLGATLYELLALRRVFDAGSDSELERQIQHEPPPRLPRSVPRDLRTICVCALAKRPRQRYASPGAMAHDLRAFLAGEPIAARPPGPIARGVALARRHPQVVLAVLVALVAWLGVRWSDRVDAARRLGEGLAAVEHLSGERTRLAGLRGEFDELFATGTPEYGPGLLLAEQLREELREQRGRVEVGFKTAETELLRAFEHVAGYAPARRALASHFAEQLEHAYLHLDDVRDPTRVKSIAARLSAYARSAEYAELLDNTGDVEIVCVVPAVTIEVLNGQGEVIRVGASPLVLSGIEEGSYMAKLVRPDGSHVRLPFLVRRRACYGDPHALPERRLVVAELPEAEEIPEGMVFVPEGWTLVEDDPVRWEFVEAFMIGANEETYADWIEWLNGLPDARSFASQRNPESVFGKPRYGENVGDLHVDYVEEKWVAGGKFDPAFPVRGLTMMEMNDYASSLNLFRGNPRWTWSLPTTAEWIRAARGADARAYPWGDDFEAGDCVSFLRDQSQVVAELERIGAAPSDCSPFLVHDMAGSVAEATIDAFGAHRGNTAVCGGSYRSYHRKEMRVDAKYATGNGLLLDVGVRLVRRPRPDTGAPALEADFHDDFDRPDSSTLGREWVSSPGGPVVYPRRRQSAERCAISDGRLVCEGGVGNESWSSSAWHPVHVDVDRGVTVSAILSIRPNAEGVIGNCRVWLRSDVVENYSDTEVGLKLVKEGPEIAFRLPVAHPDARQTLLGSPLAGEGPYHFELSLVGTSLEGRVWPVGEERPSAGLPLELPATPQGLRYVGFTAGPNSGVMELEVVSVE